MIIKKKKNQAKLKWNYRRVQFEETCLYSRLPCSVPTFFFLINHTRKFFWHSNLNEPQRKNFVLIIISFQRSIFKPVPNYLNYSFKCLVYSFIQITITNLNSKFYIHYLKSCYFLNNWVSKFLEERSSAICTSLPCNMGMKNWNQEVRSGVSHYTTFHKT